jgi:hypothetical protein
MSLNHNAVSFIPCSRRSDQWSWGWRLDGDAAISGGSILLSFVVSSYCEDLWFFVNVLLTTFQAYCPYSLYSLLEFVIREKNRESSSECTTSKARPNWVAGAACSPCSYDCPGKIQVHLLSFFLSSLGFHVSGIFCIRIRKHSQW